MDPQLPGRNDGNAKEQWEQSFAEEMWKLGKKN
jgi:hypothetical protein